MPKTPGSGMSTDWEKYATAEQTRHRGRQPAENYAVIELVAGEVRGVPEQTVVHTPNRELDNRAHTDVFGEKTPEVRLKLMALYRMTISVS